MLSDLFNAICKQAVDAARPDVVKIAGDPTTRLIKLEGKWQKHPLPPPLRRHEVFGLADFIEAAKRWGASTGGEDAGEAVDGVVWHADNLMQLVCDDGDRRELVFLRLPFAEPFKTLANLKKQSVFDHPPFIRLLRHDLHGVIAESYLTLVRKVSFAGRSGASSEQLTGRNKGTMEFDREMVNAAAIDEIWQATVSVYNIAGLQRTRTVRLTFDVDVDRQKFSLTTLPDEIETAVQDAQLELARSLAEALPNFAVLYGDPHVADLSLGAIVRAEDGVFDDDDD